MTMRKHFYSEGNQTLAQKRDCEVPICLTGHGPVQNADPACTMEGVTLSLPT